MAKFSIVTPLVLGFLFCITGCQQRIMVPSSAASQPINAVEEAVVETFSENSGIEPTRPSMVERLLDQAELAFREGRFTTPVHDNAYDRFQSVLILAPDNPQARAGLQAILLRYAGLVRSALSQSRIRAAEANLEYIAESFPGNPLVDDLSKQIDRAKARQRQAVLVKQTVPEEDQEDIPLSVDELNRKSIEIIDFLSELAQRLRTSNESVLIYARSDREGRWIYAKLKEAADGYRVRGDIRISRAPKITILPPL